MSFRWGVVVPSNRPDRLAAFERAWERVFERHRVGLFVVRDAEPWPGIPPWIPKRTDAIRSWGIVQAVQAGCTHVLSLDDDVVPLDRTLIDDRPDPFRSYEVEFERGAVVSDWLSVGALTDTGLQMRGFPHRDTVRRQVAVQYGGWTGVPDLDGTTQYEYHVDDAEFAPVVLPVPVGVPVTTCAMNVAFPAWFAIAMWQLPVLEGRYDRWCDIWSGLVQKRVADVCGLAVLVNGAASVHHTRASDVAVNIRKEAPGYAIHDGLWEALGGVIAPWSSDPDRRVMDGVEDVPSAWRAISGALADHVEAKGDAAWADRLREDRDRWAALFS